MDVIIPLKFLFIFFIAVIAGVIAIIVYCCAKAPVPPDIAGQIEKLDQLRRNGLITDEEFARQKQ